MLVLFYKKKFNRRFPVYDQLQIDRLASILPKDVDFVFSDEKNLLATADAVIFDLPFITSFFRQEGLVKLENQIWIAWCLECEQNYPWILSPDIKERFDIWMTYHLDSDVVLPYYDASFAERLQIPPGKKEKNICMFISSSVNQSKRLDYLKELMKYIEIDSYGLWARNRTLPDDAGYPSKLSVCEKYKFTIAFENAIGRDYVTEKFFDPLLAGSVPVYLGAPNIDSFSPGKKSYIDVRKYPSPKELAEVLLQYCENEILYRELVEWKNYPLNESLRKLIDAQKIHPFVRLIDKIKSLETPRLDLPETGEKVSVVIPYYNNEDTIEDTLRSVISQTYRNLEINVVDDGSGHDISVLIDKIGDNRIRYYRLEHGNANVARNFGIRKSTGDFIAFLDADDQWKEDHLLYSVNKIKKENSDGIYGSVILKKDGISEGSVSFVRELKEGEKMIDYLLQTGFGAQTSTLLVRAAAAMEVLWDEELQRHQDYDFVVRFSKKYTFSALKKPTVIYCQKQKKEMIDFQSCIRFIKKYREEIAPDLYINYHLGMLRYARQMQADEKIIRYYKRETTRYKELLSLQRYIFLREPANIWEYMRLKIEYILYLVFSL